MEVKFLIEEEYIEALKLSMYAFQYNIPEEKIQARKDSLKDQKILGIWKDNNLAAKLHIIPFAVYMNGDEWKMGGIADVATYPEYRRSGFIKMLIIESLKQMQKDRQIVSLLHPFNISFYRKFGWEILSENKKVTIEKSNLNFLNQQTGTIKRFSRNTHNEDIDSVYQEYCKTFVGMLVRNSKWWKEHVYNDDLQTAVYYNKSNVAMGYMLYKVKERKMDIQEMATLNHESRIGLWNFICQHDSMVDDVSLNLSVHDYLPYFLRNPQVKIEEFPYFMARVVDAEECLKRYPFVKENGKVFLHLEDTYAPWNNGSYLIGNGEVKAFKEKVGSRWAHPPKKKIELTINALSAILFGYKRPFELYEMDYITGSKEEIDQLERMIPQTKACFYDFF